MLYKKVTFILDLNYHAIQVKFEKYHNSLIVSLACDSETSKDQFKCFHTQHFYVELM